MSGTIAASELKGKLDRREDVVLVDERRKADYEALLFIT